MAKKQSSNGPGIRITSVEVDNFHRLTFARCKADPDGGLIRITGKNAAGKTTFLKAIAGVLGGGTEIRPDAIHESADGASITLTLTNGFTVSRVFTESAPKGYLSVIGPDGGKHQQKKLNEWLGDGSFDPLSFFSIKPDKQREVLLSISDDPELSKKLDSLRYEQQLIKEERTPWISQKQVCDRMKAPEGERPEPVDVSAEMGRLQELQTHEAEREKKRLAVEKWASLVASHYTLIEDAKQQIAKLEGLIGEEEAAADETEEVRVEAQLEYDEMTDLSEDILITSERISEADEVNEALEPWKAWDKAQVEGTEAAGQVKTMNAQIKEVKDKERDLMANAGIPIDDLSFDEETGEPLLHGHPLSVASGRERIDVAVSVALAADPELKICLLDEANDLDLESLELLNARAAKHGFQIWAVRIGLEGAGEIVVEDGVAKNGGEPC